MSRAILIMAGGTGGHIFPALAVADILRSQDWRITWLGAPNSMEAELVPKHGYSMALVRFSGVRGKGLLRKLILPVNLLIALWESAAAILRHRPDVVLGMGGYITFPGGLMATLLRRPLVIHEQNSIAGLSNRVLAHFAQKVLSGFPGVLPKAEWCGNPVRSSIANLPEPKQRYATRSGKLNVLVVGGSLGAKAINEAMPQALAMLSKQERPNGQARFPLPNPLPMPSPQSSDGTTGHSARPPKDGDQVAGYPASGRGSEREVVQAGILSQDKNSQKQLLIPAGEGGKDSLRECPFNVVHQTGKQHFDEVQQLYRQAGVQADIRPFIDDMASSYANADVVICRAGALTIAELAAAGVASILIPFPFAVDDHQTHNAQFLSRQGAAVLLPQSELSAEKLAQLLLDLADGERGRAKLRAMALQARSVAKPDAALAVARMCKEALR